ncbi:MAG TPA: hypothetical protein VFZ58_02065 [Candidatus Saccharimonadales bacterium]
MKKENKNTQAATKTANAAMVIDHALTEDVKTSLLVVSVLVNLFFFTSWLVVQSTTAYDQQVIAWLFTR